MTTSVITSDNWRRIVVRSYLVLLGVGFIALLGCLGQSPQKDNTTESPPTAAKVRLAGAFISGRVLFRQKDKAELIAAPGVAVYPVSIPDTCKFPAHTHNVRIELCNRMLTPNFYCIQMDQSVQYALVEPPGQTHNISIAEPKSARVQNLLLTDTKREGTITFSSPGEMKFFGCSIHPSERGMLTVLAHPVFAQTATDGTYRLPYPLPPGDYQIRVRHPGYELQTIPVKLDGTKAQVTLDCVLQQYNDD